jgi:hypothetical protein
MQSLFQNPLLLVLLLMAVMLPIFNGRTLLQFLLSLLLPSPVPASLQAWEHYLRLAQQALLDGDAKRVNDYTERAAKEAAHYRTIEMEFSPAGWLEQLWRSPNQLVTLLLVGLVVVLLLGGCGGCARPMHAANDAPETTAVWQTPSYQPELPVPVELPPQADLAVEPSDAAPAEATAPAQSQVEADMQPVPRPQPPRVPVEATSRPAASVARPRVYYTRQVPVQVYRPVRRIYRR